MNKLVLFALSSLVVVSGTVIYAQAPSSENELTPSSTETPEEQSDPFPSSCVDCHLNYPERGLDVRFSTLLKQWSTNVEPVLLARAQAVAPKGVKLVGTHPNASDSLKDLPDGCTSCHSGRSSAPEFGVLIHAVHFNGGSENHYVAEFGGECKHCHKMNAVDGTVNIPSAPER